MRLWIGGYGPEDSAHGRGLAAFRDRVHAATGGEVSVEVTWNIMDQGRPNTDLFRLVESGKMFMCYFSSSYMGARVPELNLLETPYLFSTLQQAHRALDGALGDRLRAAVRERTGFEVLGFWDNGFRHFTNRSRPVHRPEDCRGMTVRMQPNRVHEELIRCWGATPVAVELSEGIRLITTGEVEAQENPLANTVAYGVDRVHPHITMTGHLYGARALFANRDLIEGLPDQLRRIVAEAAREAVQLQRREAADLERRLRRRLEESGTRFVDLNEEEHARFVEAAAPAIRLAEEGLPSDLLQRAGW